MYVLIIVSKALLYISLNSSLAKLHVTLFLGVWIEMNVKIVL